MFACMQVDRKKLKTDKQFTPNWQSAASAGAEEEYEPPSSPLEEKIQKVWQEVLGQEKISVAADFFQIGGNSLRVKPICHDNIIAPRSASWDQPTYPYPRINHTGGPGHLQHAHASKGSALMG